MANKRTRVWFITRIIWGKGLIGLITFLMSRYTRVSKSKFFKLDSSPLMCIKRPPNETNTDL
jgi:hypothetical protein